MTYADLLKKYRAGTVEETDLVGVAAEDWMKVRLEGGDGTLSCALSDQALTGKKKKDDGKKSYSYVFVSDGLIPPFNDRVEAKAWDVKEFKYRGSNILYDHNIEEARPPIGKASNLQKGVELKRGGESFKALTGDVTFADAEVYPFAGMIADLVEADLITNGSVGFDIVKMRAPTEAEQEEHGMKGYSAIIQKANLIEYSITPLGRDKNAQKLSSDGTDLLEAKLAEFAEAGVYGDDVIGEFREGVLSGKAEATRFQVQRPELPAFKWTKDLDSPVVVVENKTGAFEAATTTNFVSPSEGTTANFTVLDFDNATPPLEPFTITTPATGGLVTYVDTTARTEIEQLRTELVALRAEVAELREQATKTNSTPEDELYDLLFDQVDEQAPDDSESPNRDDSESDLFTIAEDLGFTP